MLKETILFALVLGSLLSCCVCLVLMWKAKGEAKEVEESEEIDLGI